MKVLSLLTCILFFNLYSSDTFEITERLGIFYSNNPSAKNSQSKLNPQESLLAEQNTCKQCNKEISGSKIICNTCKIKKKIKSFTQKLFSSNSSKNTKKIRRSPYKKETTDSLFYFLVHNISWRKK